MCEVPVLSASVFFGSGTTYAQPQTIDITEPSLDCVDFTANEGGASVVDDDGNVFVQSGTLVTYNMSLGHSTDSTASAYGVQLGPFSELTDPPIAQLLRACLIIGNSSRPDTGSISCELTNVSSNALLVDVDSASVTISHVPLNATARVILEVLVLDAVRTGEVLAVAPTVSWVSIPAASEADTDDDVAAREYDGDVNCDALTHDVLIPNLGLVVLDVGTYQLDYCCLLYTSPSPRDRG